MRREPVPAGAVKPEFIQRIQDVEIVEGSAAKFDVRVKGNYSLIGMFDFFSCLCVCFALFFFRSFAFPYSRVLTTRAPLRMLVSNFSVGVHCALLNQCFRGSHMEKSVKQCVSDMEAGATVNDRRKY